MENVTYTTLNFQKPSEVYRTAQIHESAPLNWDPTYRVTEEQIQNWCKFLRASADNKDLLMLLAKTPEGEIIGMHWVALSEKHEEKVAHIHSLWVSEEHREQGIGKELKRLGERWAKQNGATMMITGVFHNNQNMIEFNMKIGFKAQQVEMTKKL